jgi:hypothetical protein
MDTDSAGQVLHVTSMSDLDGPGAVFGKDVTGQLATDLAENNEGGARRAQYWVVLSDADAAVLERTIAGSPLSAHLSESSAFRMAAWSGRDAATWIAEQLTARGLHPNLAALRALNAGLDVLAALPGWRSALDAKELASAITSANGSAGATLNAGIVKRVIDDKLAARRNRPAPAPSSPKPNLPIAAAHATASAAQANTDTEVVAELALTAAEKALIDAKAEVAAVEPFSSRFRNNPAALEAAEADADSDYMREVRKVSGLDKSTATQAQKLIREKVKRLVQVEMTTLQKVFRYHCPYCGGIDSPSCAYIRNSLEWKIEHSLKKPEVIEIVVTKDVEVEEIVQRAV